MSSGVAARAAVEFREARRQMRREAGGQNNAQPKAAQQKNAQPKNAEQKSAQPKNADNNGARRQRPTVGVAPQELYLTEARARIDAALEAEIGFVERLVWFWSNHFCVSADKTVDGRRL